MRKIFIILMLLPCFSCTDWLNVESEKSVTYLNYFKSESDLEKVLISIFGYEKALYAPANPEAFGYVGLLCDDAGMCVNLIRGPKLTDRIILSLVCKNIQY